MCCCEGSRFRCVAVKEAASDVAVGAGADAAAASEVFAIAAAIQPQP
jgi:hypothetical protein